MRALVVLVLLARGAYGDVTALPCRPTIACTAELTPPGTAELELGYLYRRLAGDANQSTLPFLLKLTLLDWAQVQLGSNGPTTAPGEHFFDDITFGVKVRAHAQTPQIPALSLSATLSIPTAAAPGYVRTYDALFTAYATKDVGWLHADFNVGASLWRLENTPVSQAWIALALSTMLGRGIGAMAEAYHFTDASPMSPRDGGVLAAISYQPRSWIVLDAGGDLGLSAKRVASAFVGMTVAHRVFGE